MLAELTCPLTLELLEDPVYVPCCGKAMSRAPLSQHLLSRDNCPLCRADLSAFNITTARNLAGLVETLREEEKKKNRPPSHCWSATITQLLHPMFLRPLPISQLRLTLERAQFAVKPSLFVAVVDRSGSMAGAPWRQVETALLHIVGLAHHTTVQIAIIAYASFAETIDLAHKTPEEVRDVIKRLFTGGGTNFSAAFAEIRKVLLQQKDMSRFSSVSIVFLTDGEAGSNMSPILSRELQEILAMPSPPIRVHSVGFGANCDKILLEAIRKTGTEEGTFRYAEPSDQGDLLCHKLTSLFQLANFATLSKVHLFLRGGVFRDTKLPAKEVSFVVDAHHRGEVRTFVEGDGKLSLEITSAHDDHVTPDLTKVQASAQFTDDWVCHEIDSLASASLTLLQEVAKEDFELRSALLQQKIDALMALSTAENVLQRLEFLRKNLQERSAKDLGRLADLRFSSQFVEHKEKYYRIPFQEQRLIQEEQERDVFYSHNNHGKGRNALQEAIMNDTPRLLLPLATHEDVAFLDADGNNALHLAAYCGQIDTVNDLLSKSLDIDTPNAQGETAATLAIKKRGFHKTLGLLSSRGATIPAGRRKALQKFAMLKGYTITAQFLARFTSDDVDETMTCEFIEFMYDKATESKGLLKAKQYLEVCTAKKMVSLVRKLIGVHGAKPTLRLLLDHCIPSSVLKEGDPQVTLYLELAQLFLQHDPSLVFQQDEENKESALFKAAERGSLVHVELLLSYKAEVDLPNALGNTPLWIACAKYYPCIIDKLLEHGANVNHQNHKGNPPLYSLCHRGPLKIAETLLSHRAKVDVLNTNGDSLVLLACRNGQDSLLRLLLNHTPPELLDHKAHIDGFNALFASVEQNKPRCIEVLCQEASVNLEQKTDKDNAILASATPLQLAAYYGRLDSTRTLLSLKANPEALDDAGRTALHIAVIQGNTSILHALRTVTSVQAQRDAMSYAKDKPDILKFLVNPALEPLMKLARCSSLPLLSVLRENAGLLPGVLSAADAVDVQDADGCTPLLQAVLYGQVAVVKTLLELGANKYLKNRFGLDASDFACWIQNPRIASLFETRSRALERLTQAAAKDVPSRLILFLGVRPPGDIEKPLESFQARMQQFVHVAKRKTGEREAKSPSPAFPLVPVTQLEAHFFSKGPNQCIFNAKVFVVNQVGGGTEEKLSVPQRFALALYTNNAILCKALNQSLDNLEMPAANFLSVFSSALDVLPPYGGEAFVASESLDRSRFLPGDLVSFGVFLSTTALWRTALEATPQFATKTRQGTVLLFKSRTGRHVASFSESFCDAEVIFPPESIFRVQSWYEGDVIALGQANIREKTFGLSKEQQDSFLHNNKSLIIELCET